MIRSLLLLLALLATPIGARAPVADPTLAADLARVGLDDPDRTVIKARDAIVAALELKPGMRVADIGAGTGAFMEAIAAAVGPSGRYAGVDIDPKQVALMQRRARALGLENVEVIESRPDSARLREASTDLALVIDTYHHFDPPAPMLASIRAALKPGGALVIVDFDRRPFSSAWVKSHVRANRATFRREIEAAGFRFDRDLAVPGIPGHYAERYIRP